MIQTRIDLVHCLPTETEPPDGARRETLDQHITLLKHLVQEFYRARIRAIDANALLAAIALDLIAGAPVTQIGQGTRSFTIRRELDLDHLGAHLGQEPRRGRSSQDLRKVQYSNAVENIL